MVMHWLTKPERFDAGESFTYPASTGCLATSTLSAGKEEDRPR